MKRSLVVAGGVVCGTMIAVGATAYGLSADGSGAAGPGSSVAQVAADDGGDGGGDGDGDGDDGDGSKEPWRLLDELPRLEDVGRAQLLHSESVTKDRETGEITYVNSQLGKVTAASGSTLTVKSSDGVTWEWQLTDDTRYWADGDASDVETGDTVLVSGTRDGGSRTAEHVGDPPPDPEKLREKLREGLEEGLDELPEELPDLREGLPERFREKLPDSRWEEPGEDEAASPV